MSKKSLPQSGAGQPVEKPRCGLCGKAGKLTRTPCCGNWICDDADQYVPFSYARNSCFTNHSKYTICASHHHEKHEGRWQDCAACRKSQPLELYVHHATNEHNFERLADPPEFAPTHCAGCGVVIRLAQDGYTLKGDSHYCEACGMGESGASTRQFLEQFSPPASAPSGIERVPVRVVGQRGRYPLASLAHYGPDNTRATKLVVSVLRNESEQDGPLHRWITQAGDIREDAAITAEVETFLKQHGVRSRIITERIIGCPHEEGKDYPMGGVCPHCPFWHNRDRFTHELPPPPPELTPAQILAELAGAENRQPRDAILAADAHREALVEPLLRAVERGVADPSGTPPSEAMLFSFATYLLARWREPRAYPAFIRWLSLPGEGAFDIGGDTVTQEGGRFLALVCAGNLEPIKKLILDREANEYCRGQAVEALALLAAWRELPHAEVTDYFAWLAREGLEREPGHVWDALAASSADIEALDVFPELRRAFEEGLTDPGFISEKELDKVENGPRGTELAQFRERHPPSIDVVRDTGWWECFRDDPVRTQERNRSRGLVENFLPDAAWPPPASGFAQPFRAPPKVGRNDPCPCGSGKKFKKCCGK
jgi:hypothetical protein